MERDLLKKKKMMMMSMMVRYCNMYLAVRVDDVFMVGFERPRSLRSS